jgi:hypothetical protein
VTLRDRVPGCDDQFLHERGRLAEVRRPAVDPYGRDVQVAAQVEIEARQRLGRAGVHRDGTGQPLRLRRVADGDVVGPDAVTTVALAREVRVAAGPVARARRLGAGRGCDRGCGERTRNEKQGQQQRRCAPGQSHARHAAMPRRHASGRGEQPCQFTFDA